MKREEGLNVFKKEKKKQLFTFLIKNDFWWRISINACIRMKQPTLEPLLQIFLSFFIYFLLEPWTGTRVYCNLFYTHTHTHCISIGPAKEILCRVHVRTVVCQMMTHALYTLIHCSRQESFPRSAPLFTEVQFYTSVQTKPALSTGLILNLNSPGTLGYRMAQKTNVNG